MAKIVVADDHPHIARLVRRELEQEGHQVFTAADGEEALAAIRQEQPALVILDVTMPKLTGFQVLQALKSDAATQPIPVIFLTVRDEPIDVTHGLQLGADWYLPKPFAPGDISTVVRRFLADPSA